MRFSYPGRPYDILYCYNYNEAVEKIKNFEKFSVNNRNYYYQLSSASSSGTCPEDIFLLEMICKNSVNAKHTYFVQIKPSESKKDVFYFGANLENHILKMLNLWGGKMNAETLTAFGGRRFKSFLNAIPKEILLKDNFIKRAKKALSAGFNNRPFKIEEADLITDLATKNLEKRRDAEKENNNSASKKVAKLLKELG